MEPNGAGFLDGGTFAGLVLPLIVLAAIIWWVLRRRRLIGRYRAEAARAQAELDAYAAAVAPALDAEPDQIDWAELRRLYSASIDYWGESRFGERDQVEVEVEAGGGPADVTRMLLLRDFPLLETQLAAAGYYDAHPEEGGQAAADRCRRRFEALARFIRDSAAESGEGPVCKVLSIEEEYLLMDWLGLRPADPETDARQELVEIDGRPHDRFELGAKVVLFDISSFYGLPALRAMAAAGNAGGRDG